MDFGEESFRRRLVGALNEHERFERHTRWFDGTILVDGGGTVCWLKVYRGKVLESLDYTPPLGYTFKLTGSDNAWGMWLRKERFWPDLVTAGTRYFDSPEDVLKADPMRPAEIRCEGNVLEAQRLVRAVSAIGECIRSCVNNGNGVN